jgi:hypothetical protein
VAFGALFPSVTKPNAPQCHLNVVLVEVVHFFVAYGLARNKNNKASLYLTY